MRTGLPLGLFYLFNPVLLMNPLIGEGSAGVQFIPQLLLLDTTSSIYSLGACFLGILVITALGRVSWVRDFIPYLSIAGSTILLVYVYFTPFVYSLLREISYLFQTQPEGPLLFALFGYLFGLLQVLDILLVYVAGGLCFVFLLCPVWLRSTSLKWMKHYKPFERFFTVAERTHLLEYYDEARERYAGNIVHHLGHYMRQCDQHGVSKAKQAQLIRAHDYPAYLLQRARRHVLLDKRKIFKP